MEHNKNLNQPITCLIGWQTGEPQQGKGNQTAWAGFAARGL